MDLEPLDRAFYLPSASVVAPELLGHWLVRRWKGVWCGGRIVETEAYLKEDPASHGFGGPTARNRVMFGPAGHAYVYLIYGYHFCVNAVCAREGVAEAVLVRAIAPELGLETLQANRPNVPLAQLTSGPAKLCQALGIDRQLDGVDLCDGGSSLWVARNPDVARWRKIHGPLVTAPRIGISRAASLPLRFYLEGSSYVSRRHRASSRSSHGGEE